MENKIIFKNQKSRETFQSPIRLLIVIIFSIIVSDVLIDIFIKVLPSLILWGELLLDSILLSIILFPFLYFFAFRPLTVTITERKRAEEMLKTNEEKYKMIFNEMPIGIAISTIEGKIIEVNKAQAEMIGYTVEELKGRSVNEYYVYPDKRMEMIGLFKKTGKVRDFEMELMKKDGSIIVELLNLDQVKIEGKDYLFVAGRDITRHKRTEEELQRSEIHYKSLSENSPDLIARFDRHCRHLYVNPAVAKAGRFTPEEYVGKTIAEVGVSEEEARKWERHIRTAFETGQVVDVEGSFETSNGSQNFHTKFVPEFAPDGSIHSVQSVARDISERKQTEEKLRLEKENFRHSLDDSPLGVRVATIEGYTIYANRTLLNFYGYDSFGELQNTPLKDRYTQESYAEAQKRKNQRERGDLSATAYEISIVRKNGEIRHLQVFRKKILWDGVNQFQVICNDITERKHAEAALKESEARYRSLFDNSLFGISTASPDERLLQTNPAYARMFGYENPEKMLAEVNDVGKLFANPVERKEVLRILNKNGFMEPKEIEVIRRDGSKFFVLVSACEIRDAEGKLLYNQATHIDLTERRIMEEELRGSKELLEKLNQRLNEIRENERAAISREIHDELGQSLTALKLDLNQLLKYIGPNTESIKKLESIIELVSNTIKNVQRISSDLRPGILDDLGLAAAIEWYSEEFEKRTAIKCRISLDDSIPADPQKDLVFFRVLQEALTNIIRHASASSVRIKLSRFKNGIVMSIQDNGKGMLPGIAKSGKSLGLIGMRERVRQFGGKIDISSNKGQGTKLTIFIPF